MSIIKSEKSSSFKGFGAITASDDGWLNALPVDVFRSDGKKCGRTTDGVWVSVGASYGAQVEFPSSAAAAAFIADSRDSARPAVGTSRPRVVCDSPETFAAAYNAATATAATAAPVEAVTVTAPATVAAPAIDAALFMAFKAFLATQAK